MAIKKTTLRKDLKELSIDSGSIAAQDKFDKKILESMGFTNIVREKEKSKKQNEYLKKYGSLIKTKDILKIRDEYGLSFFPTSYYIGEIGEKTVELSKKFVKESGVKKDCFFILAPISKFEKGKIKEEVSNIDPSLFAYVGEDLWLMIDSWGDDFTEERKMKTNADRIRYNINDNIWPMFFLLMFLQIPSIFIFANYFPHEQVVGKAITWGLIELGSLILINIWAYLSRHKDYDEMIKYRGKEVDILFERRKKDLLKGIDLKGVARYSIEWDY